MWQIKMAGIRFQGKNVCVIYVPFAVSRPEVYFPFSHFFFLVFSPIFYEKCRGKIQWKFHSATSLVASTHGNSCESHNSSLGPIQNVWNGGEDEILFQSRLLLPLPTKNPSLAAILIKENLVTLTPLIHSWHFRRKSAMGRCWCRGQQGLQLNMRHEGKLSV